VDDFSIATSSAQLTEQASWFCAQDLDHPSFHPSFPFAIRLIVFSP
jgi:hypothetical protein